MPGLIKSTSSARRQPKVSSKCMSRSSHKCRRVICRTGGAATGPTWVFDLGACAPPRYSPCIIPHYPTVAPTCTRHPETLSWHLVKCANVINVWRLVQIYRPTSLCCFFLFLLNSRSVVYKHSTVNNRCNGLESHSEKYFFQFSSDSDTQIQVKLLFFSPLLFRLFISTAHLLDF